MLVDRARGTEWWEHERGRQARKGARLSGCSLSARGSCRKPAAQWGAEGGRRVFGVARSQVVPQRPGRGSWFSQGRAWRDSQGSSPQRMVLVGVLGRQMRKRSKGLGLGLPREEGGGVVHCAGRQGGRWIWFTGSWGIVTGHSLAMVDIGPGHQRIAWEG